jgi:hypothetical protein
MQCMACSGSHACNPAALACGLEWCPLSLMKQSTPPHVSTGQRRQGAGARAVQGARLPAPVLVPQGRPGGGQGRGRRPPAADRAGRLAGQEAVVGGVCGRQGGVTGGRACKHVDAIGGTMQRAVIQRALGFPWPARRQSQRPAESTGGAAAPPDLLRSSYSAMQGRTLHSDLNR